MAELSTRVWITAELRDGVCTASVHAETAVGAGFASVHVDVPEDALADLGVSLGKAMDAATTDAIERVQEAGLSHRIRARELGEDFHAEREYVGPEVLVEHGVFSDPGVMELPIGQREKAIARGRADE